MIFLSHSSTFRYIFFWDLFKNFIRDSSRDFLIDFFRGYFMYLFWNYFLDFFTNFTWDISDIVLGIPPTKIFKYTIGGPSELLQGFLQIFSVIPSSSFPSRIYTSMQLVIPPKIILNILSEIFQWFLIDYIWVFSRDSSGDFFQALITNLCQNTSFDTSLNFVIKNTWII